MILAPEGKVDRVRKSVKEGESMNRRMRALRREPA
jgi:hypothetical protein